MSTKLELQYCLTAFLSLVEPVQEIVPLSTSSLDNSNELLLELLPVLHDSVEPVLDSVAYSLQLVALALQVRRVVGHNLLPVSPACVPLLGSNDLPLEFPGSLLVHLAVQQMQEFLILPAGAHTQTGLAPELHVTGQLCLVSPDSVDESGLLNAVPVQLGVERRVPVLQLQDEVACSRPVPYALHAVLQELFLTESLVCMRASFSTAVPVTA